MTNPLLEETTLSTPKNYLEASKHCLQNWEIAKEQDGDNSEALQALREQLTLYEKRLLELELQYWGQRNLQQCIAIITQRIAIAEALYEEASKQAALLYSDLLFYQNEFGNYEAVIVRKDSLFKTFSFDKLPLRTIIIDLHHAIAFAYREIGDYEAALSRHAKIEALLQHVTKAYFNSPEAYYNLLSAEYNNRGLCYFRLGEFKKSAFVYEQCLELLPEEHEQRATVLLNIACCYLEMKKYEQAISLLQESLTLCENLSDKWGAVITTIHNTFTTIYARLDQLDLALYHAQTSMAIGLKTLGPHHPHIATLHQNYSYILSEKKQYDKALQMIQKAIHCLIPSFKAIDSLANPPIRESQHAITLLSIFAHKLDFLLKRYEQQSHAIKDLEIALETGESAIELIALTRKGYQSDVSSLQMAKKSQLLFDKLIQVLWKLYDLTADVQYLHALFTISEHRKAVLLFGHLKDKDAQHIVAIPPHLLERKTKLKQAINALDKQIHWQKTLKAAKQISEVQAKETLTKLGGERHDLREVYQKLIEQFETDYPDYYRLKYDTKTTSIADIQKNLSNTQALISYFIGEQAIYIFAITQADFQTYRVAHTEQLSADITFFVKKISLPIAKLTPRSIKKLRRIGHELYQQLVLPFQKKLPKTIEQLIIIPDSYLAQLPYESLLCQAARPNQNRTSLDYLIQHYEISYHCSATLWHYVKQKSQSAKQASEFLTNGYFLGLAPVFATHKDSPTQVKHAESLQEVDQVEKITVRGEELTMLKYSEKEVNGIANLFKKESTVLLHEAATLKNFRKKIEQTAYDIVHIASHGIYEADKANWSSIVFSPPATEQQEGAAADLKSVLFKEDRLYLKDIYNLKLQASLVVLSCCNTGRGEIVNGEGMIAINSAFLVAGAQNIVYTLFKVPDRTSSELNILFYQKVLAGMSYPAALRAAKLQLLEQGLRPMAWAGYVLIAS